METIPNELKGGGPVAKWLRRHEGGRFGKGHDGLANGAFEKTQNAGELSPDSLNR